MGTIRKRGKSWQIDYREPGGKRIRLCFRRRKEAEAELGKRISLMAEGRYLDIKREYKTTLKELIEKYIENFKYQPAFETWKKFCLRNFKDYFGEDTLLANIRYADVETYRNRLMQKPTRSGKIRSVAAINREMGVLRHLFRKAVEWEMIEKSPFDMGKSLQLKENNNRVRYLTEDEIKRLLEECKHQKHLYWIVVCALNTGMRRGEILNLKWENIRNGFIYLEKTKTKERREIPINDELDRVFKEIRKEQGLSSEYVFTYQRKHILRIDRSFKGALRRAGIENFRFHDLRHTFASHLVMKGATIKEVQELLGHKTISMTMRYAHLSPEHKKRAVNLLNGLTGQVKWSQMVTKSDSPENTIQLSY